MTRNRDLLIDTLLEPQTTATLDLQQWDTLIRQARASQLLVRLAAYLLESPQVEKVPSGPRAHLESILRLRDHQRSAVRNEVAHLLLACEQVGVPLVLLKGAAYEMADLPPGRCRIYSDLDLLVSRADIQTLETALMTHGWSSGHQSAYDQKYYRTWMHELPPMRHITRHSVIDVHHNLVPDTARMRPDPAKLLSARVACSKAPDVHVLCGEDMILHSAVHLFHDGEFDHALRDLFDIRDLVEHFMRSDDDWLALVDRAVALNLARPLHYALRYLQRLLRARIPAQTIAALRRHGPMGPWVALCDQMFERGLRPMHETCDDRFSPVARFVLYVRGHSLRMPAHLLIPHLLRKAAIRSNLLPEAANPR